MVVNPALVSPAVKDVTTIVHKAAEEAVQDVRERMIELRDDAMHHGKQKHRGRSLTIFLLVVIGLAAIAMYMKRRQEAADYGPPSDAFGAALVAQHHAGNGGKQPVATPGA